MTANPRRFWWVVTGTYAIVVLVLSVIPTSGDLGPEHIDKVAHVCMYFLFAWLLVQVVRVTTTRPPVGEAGPPAGEAGMTESVYLLWAWIYAFSYGLLMEVLQFFLPWRGASAMDVVMNGLGAALGIWLARRWPRPTTR